MLKKILVSLMSLLLIIGGANIMAESSQVKTNNQVWDKTFQKSDKVNIQKVSFKNRYGIEIVGDLYTPKGAKIN